MREVRKVMPFPVDLLRKEFPALQLAHRFLFFDNAAGAQIPARVLEAVRDHLVVRNVQRGGPYRQSREVDAMIVRARESVADLVNARSADEIAFGLNATSFIRSISLAIGQTLASRPEIVITDLDHEANIATWLALERQGAKIVWWPVRDDGRLHPADLDGLLSERTRLVACSVASNATGSLVDVAEVARRAHRVEAPRYFSTPCIMVRTVRSMCRRSTATISFVRATRFLPRTWASHGAGWNRSAACRRFVSISSPT